MVEGVDTGMGDDLVIRGGTLVDGTGAPGRVADVVVRDGKIAAIGEGLSGPAELDASGQVVAPGFIDIHTHYDAQVFWDPDLTPSSHHGVTTVIAGNCGFSIAPTRPEGVELLVRTLQHVEDMSFDTLMAGVPWDEFETFPQYLDAVERRGVGLNYGCYVGHTAVRLFTMGDDAYERGATDDEMIAMVQIVDEALDAGAIGFASSWSPTHNGDHGRPVPSRVADLNELAALLEPLHGRSRGVAALLPGGIMSHSEMFELQRHIGRPFTWTALLTFAGSDYHEQVMAEHAAARSTGVDVWPQVSCRPLVFQMNLAEPFSLNTFPNFNALMDSRVEERTAAYRDPAWRANAWEQLNSSAFSLFNVDSLSVAESPNRPDLVGRRVVELAQEQGVTPLDVMLDLSLADSLATRFWSVLANDNTEGIASLLPRDDVLLGLADSGAHVSQLCDACFATDLLGNWVRERQVMSLEHAVHKLTGEPARVYGLADRGSVEIGKAADLVVFDPDTIGPGQLRRVTDFPANGERLTADTPMGMTHTLVNGVPIRIDGHPVPEGLATRPGTVLRS
ncbi:MAG: N-acyl-D-amino-acid deacylase family protein [Acidimicrobiales bacterium]|jgi:N-acyl-D-aspartate/D-glutamate deacylase